MSENKWKIKRERKDEGEKMRATDKGWVKERERKREAEKDWGELLSKKQRGRDGKIW